MAADYNPATSLSAEFNVRALADTKKNPVFSISQRVQTLKDSHSTLMLMTHGCLLYYITDRTQFRGNDAERQRALLAKIGEAANCGVDYIQLREKDLSVRELEDLGLEAVSILRQRRVANGPGARTRLLINSRTDLAFAVGADGVHLRSEDISAACPRSIWDKASANGPEPAVRSPLIAISCHTPLEVAGAAREGADFAVFGPVFEKQSLPKVWPAGLDGLREACRTGIPVLALGGVTLENAAACLRASASGIAGIRIFQESRIEDVVGALRAR
jgi:thiamine-phosphate pyrophosphorylase